MVFGHPPTYHTKEFLSFFVGELFSVVFLLARTGKKSVVLRVFSLVFPKKQRKEDQRVRFGAAFFSHPLILQGVGI